MNKWPLRIIKILISFSKIKKKSKVLYDGHPQAYIIIKKILINFLFQNNVVLIWQWKPLKFQVGNGQQVDVISAEEIKEQALQNQTNVNWWLELMQIHTIPHEEAGTFLKEGELFSNYLFKEKRWRFSNFYKSNQRIFILLKAIQSQVVYRLLICFWWNIFIRPLSYMLPSWRWIYQTTVVISFIKFI